MSKKNIHQLWKTDVPDGHVDKPWTNNNSESTNHVFNMSILWESKPLLDLVQIIEDIMSTQYKDHLRPIVIITEGLVLPAKEAVRRDLFSETHLEDCCLYLTSRKSTSRQSPNEIKIKVLQRGLLFKNRIRCTFDPFRPGENEYFFKTKSVYYKNNWMVNFKIDSCIEMPNAKADNITYESSSRELSFQDMAVFASDGAAVFTGRINGVSKQHNVGFKKLEAAAEKSGGKDIRPWITSIVNHVVVTEDELFEVSVDEEVKKMSSTCFNCKLIFNFCSSLQRENRGQFRNAPIAELRQHKAANPDLGIAMAATMQNTEDEIVEPSSSTENTNNDNLDDTIPCIICLKRQEKSATEICLPTSQTKEQTPSSTVRGSTAKGSRAGGSKTAMGRNADRRTRTATTARLETTAD
ncbi:unnamed protein product [Mytilus edulis]|uniref:Uncharacterized protein n=1 Tax=Mytilus edulis TaxID=6550 RepID=A0A8S3Q7V0_MYTED|nr:unnamed protein product [Mytilus edulis]